MAIRITKSDLLFVIGECKKTIEKAQPDVHPNMHKRVSADQKRTLEKAYFMLDAAEEVAGSDKPLAEAYINQAIGLMKAWDIDPTKGFDERMLAHPASKKPS